MELRHLRYFVTTAQLEHFGRAAARLSIVQPALSKQIRELEEEIGTPLFERLPRGVKLTAAGRAFLEEAERVLQDVDAASQRARDVAQGKIGGLRVGFVDTAIYHSIVPRVFHEFRQRWPAVDLELIQQPSAAQGELLRAGSLDVGFVFHHPANLPPLAAQFITVDPIQLAVPTAHGLARRRQVRLNELKNEPFVWIPRALSPNFHDAIFAACARHGFTPHVVQEGNTDLTLLSLVAAGAGLTFCVASAKARKPADVTLLKVTDLKLTVRLDAIWRTDNPNPALPHFLALVRSIAPRAAPKR
jgi:DNA-binding transcriptional LysR family regulator